MHGVWTPLFAFALLSAGCSGDLPPPPRAQTCQAGGNGNDGGAIDGLASGSSNGTCSDLLSGTVGEGQSCTASKDCQPTCCACPTGVRSAQAAWCRDGTCAPSDDVCCAFAALYADDGGLLCNQ